MDKLRVCFLVTGSMGSAVLHGLIASGHPKVLISATTNSTATAAKLRELGISAMAVEESQDANALMSADADLIVLGVKPNNVAKVLTEIADEIGKNAVVISMAAGFSLESMAQTLPDNPNLIRTMPNTPSLVGKGVTGLSVGPNCSREASEAAAELFAAVGSVIEIPEEKINPLSAISGSGPAWVYYFIEQWEEIAIAQGFSKEQAELMVRGTFEGALELLARAEKEPWELRKNVSSPGGTTEQIIKTFENAKLQEVFAAGLEAAVLRAEEIARSGQ
jgi:pyrroline-5-carboxylate reductase